MAEAAVEFAETQETRVAARKSLWFAPATFFVLLLGGVEGWYGKTAAGDVYGSDAVQYLDIARAFERGDLHSALNPLWSQGYPALLALARPVFAAGNAGEWNSIRLVNFLIFACSWLCFAGFVRELLRGRRRTAVTMVGAVCIFLTAQLCMDQVSRVGPDQLVAAIFFLVCGLLLRMLHDSGPRLSLLLGLALGLGFLAKAIFLPLGCVSLLLVVVSLIGKRRKLSEILPAAGLFLVIVLGYGAALSHEFGSPTLGEAGSLNYAWHVDRLAKWVHWEGGIDPADKAWPKPWIARFTHWQSDPPDFGRPIHPSTMIGTAPTVYAFEGPVQATYPPYFDAPYWYQGYKHPVRWRYQVVALGKNLGDLAVVVLKQPLICALIMSYLLLFWRRADRAALWSHLPGWLGRVWPAHLLAGAALVIYLPVHLEGRYIAAFLAVLLLMKLEAFSPVLERSPLQRKVVLALIAVGFTAGLVKDQHEVWSRAVHRWKYQDNLEWREGAALRAVGFAPGSEIGVISWTPNVQCDWAYLADVRITSEIESPQDERMFWELAPLDQNAVMLRFRQAGAVAVVTRDRLKDGMPGWEQVGSLPMWVYRF